MILFSFLGESETHLFRHASEITRETKGGYLKGKIIVPKSTKPCYLRLSLVPAEPDLQTNAFHLHPNLLHINLRQNKKNRNLEVRYPKLKTIISKTRIFGAYGPIMFALRVWVGSGASWRGGPLYENCSFLSIPT